VLVTFEEEREDLLENLASLGLELPALIDANQLRIEPCVLRSSEIVRDGRFNLEGLFVRLERAVEAVGARRVALDTIELLLGAFGDEFTVRSELDRLFHWLRQRRLTTVVTGERGPAHQLTRHGIEEYVSDCVVVLDHRVENQVSTRRLRVMKYRGSAHGTNEYPFVINEQGLSVLPITAMGLTYGAPDDLISSGCERLDQMLGGGVYRGSTMLITGSAGTGKTTLAFQVVAASCARGERALVLSFEESPAQLIRNLSSVGLELQPWVEAGLLTIESQRSTSYGLEEHLARLEQLVSQVEPQLVMVDAMGSVSHVGSAQQVTAMVAREIDLMKARGVTFLFTSLTAAEADESSAVGVSSLTDTWLELRNLESDGERNRLLYVIKSRGMAHSNQVREFRMSRHGIELLDVMVGRQGVVTGSARWKEEQRLQAESDNRQALVVQQRRALAARCAAVEAQIAALRSGLEAEVSGLESSIAEAERRDQAELSSSQRLAQQREVPQ
jgi:circadian clock protein KaiC